MAQIKLRVGKVTADETIPPLGILAEKAENAGIRGQRGERRYIQEQVLKNEEDSEREYLYLYYTQEVTEEVKQFVKEEEPDEEDEDVVSVDDNPIAREMRFLIRPDNWYIFESTRGITGGDAVRFITEDLDVTGLDCDLTENFPRSWLQSFYQDIYSVRKVKLNDISEYTSEDLDDNIDDLIEEAGGPSELIEFSNSGRDGNLRESSIIDGLTQRSDIKFISGESVDRDIRKIDQKGRFVITYTPDFDHEEIADEMYDASDNILNRISD